MSPSYCPAAWIGLNVLPGEARPCCQWNGEGVSIDPNKLLTSKSIYEIFEPIRQDMLNGKELDGCNQCYSAERVGAKSRRQELIEQYGLVTETSTKLLDISFDNVCNLKCRGCCSFSSHLWHSDEEHIYGESFSANKYLEHNNDFDLSNLEYINVSGGEPFLSKKFKQFANTLLKTGNIKNLHLCITSNATTLPSEEIYNLMLESKELSISLSIDGVGKLNEYFRHGADFDTCLNTINFLKDLKEKRLGKPTSLNIHTTVSIYNVNLLGEIETFFAKHYPEYQTTHRLLYWPSQLCVRNMPNDLKDKIRPIVESYGEKFSDVLAELNTNDVDLFGHFVNFHNSLDILRNESLDNLNTLLFDYIQSYSNPHKDSKTFFLTQLRG